MSTANAAAPVGEMAKRVTRAPLGRIMSQTAVPTMAPARIAAAIGMRRRRQSGGRCAARHLSTRKQRSADDEIRRLDITNSAVEMSAIRCRRSFARQRSISIRTCGGNVRRQCVPVRLALQHARERVGDVFTLRRARCPVSISYSTAPNAHTSLRLSAARPFACSGLMYAAVPRMTPASVAAGEVTVGD